jgi:hypothetical protein
VVKSFLINANFTHLIPELTQILQANNAQLSMNADSRVFISATVAIYNIQESQQKSIVPIDSNSTSQQESPTINDPKLDVAKNTSNKKILLKALNDTDIKNRQKSLRSLCADIDVGVLPEILRGLQDAATEVRTEAVVCLNTWIKDSKINDRQIAPAIITSLSSLTKVKEFPVEDWLHRELLYNRHGQIWGLINRISMVTRTDLGQIITNTDRMSYRLTALKTLEILADRGQLELDEPQIRQAIPVLMAMHNNWGNDNASSQARVINVKILKKLTDRLPIDKTAQDRTYLLWNLERSILGGVSIAALILLFSSVRLRNPFPLSWSGYLIFPEEIVAELIALKQRRQAEKVSPRRIRLELAYEVLLLLWAVHIQMRIDDIHLPPGGNDRAK